MKKLLVIEDDADMIEIIEYMFEDADFEVVHSLGKIPVDEIAKINPDVIILDYFLGEDSGSEICMEIKNSSITAHIPVVLYSTADNIQQVAINSYADGYITKPFDLSDFLRVVENLTGGLGVPVQ